MALKLGERRLLVQTMANARHRSPSGWLHGIRDTYRTTPLLLFKKQGMTPRCY
jgi:hypothetical protein